jgi:hypothetical protein
VQVKRAWCGCVRMAAIMAKQKKIKDVSSDTLLAMEDALRLDNLMPSAEASAPELKLPSIADDPFSSAVTPKAPVAKPYQDAQAVVQSTVNVAPVISAPEVQTLDTVKPEAPAKSDVSVPRRPKRMELPQPAAEQMTAPEPRAVVAPDTARVANDDSRDSTALVQAFAIKPSRRAYIMATLASLLWLAGSYFLLETRHGALPGGVAGFLSSANFGEWSLMGLWALGPIAFFCVMAALYTRTQEMRLVSRAMSDVALRLAEPESAAAGSVVSLSQAIRREVAAMGDGVERAIARAGELETIVRGEISTLERAYSDNEVRLRSLIEELVTQREAIVVNADKVRASISGAHEGLSRDLDVASRSIADAVSSAGDRVTSSLGEKGDEITQALGRTGDRMVDEITGRGADLVDRLQLTSSEVSNKLSDTTANVSASLDDKAREIVASLERTGGVLNDGLSAGAREVTRTISETGAHVAETIAARANAVNDAMRESGERLTNDIQLRGGEVTARFEESGTKLADLLSEHGKSLHERLTETGDALNKTINIDGRALSEELSARSTAMREQFVGHTTMLGQELSMRSNALSEQFAGHTTALSHELTNRSDAMREQFVGHTTALRDELGTQTEASRHALALTGKDVITALAAQAGRVNDALSKNAQALMTSVEERGGAINIQMEARLGDFSTLFDTRGREIDTTLSARFSAFEEIVVARGGALADKLARDVHGFSNSVTTQLGQVEDLMVREGQALIEKLTARTQDTTDQIYRATAETTDKLTSATAETTERLSRFTADATDQISRRTSEAAASMESQIKAFEDRSGAKSAEIATSLDGLIARIDNNLGTRASALNDALVERTIDIARVLAEGGRDVTQALGAKADEIGNLVTSKSEEMTRSLTDKADEIGMVIVQRSEGLSATLSAKAEEINQTLGGRALEIADTLDQRIAGFEERVVNRLDTVSGTLDERGRHIAETLQNQVETISTTLGHHAGELRNLFSTEGAGMVTALVQTNDKLKTELGGILGRLGEANELMQTIVGQANRNLNAVGTGLSTQVVELKTVLDRLTDETSRATLQVSDQVNALRTVSTGTLDQAGALADRLEEKGRDLADSTRISVEALSGATTRLEDVEGRMAAALTTRKDAMEDLIARVSARSEDVDAITRSFAALVEESLNTAEDRARKIGGVLADSAQATTSAITDQFETIRAATGKERERTAHALRTAYEQITTEVGGELAKATAQFTTAASELKGMTVDIQRELDATRAELKRGVVDMPRETQEATAAMRRVVAEQIKALNELSGVVTRSGRNLDVAEPVEAPRRVAPVAPAPTPAARLAETVLRRELEAPAPMVTPAPRSATRTPLPEPAPSRAGGSWLSDLLGRASREEPKAADPVAARTIERLDSLSVDIARMIDHEAAVDLWERYKRGERNVFTRRLYTLQGQQTFDEIRRRFRRDPEFKETVDRYIEEFEKLLGEVARDDRDSMVAKTYLTSDTGKVYTMLAHASGRFE